MHTHIDCICWVLLHCAFSNVSSNFLPERRQNHSGCICLTFLHCGFSNESSNGLPVKNAKLHWLHVYYFSPLCVFKCLPKLLHIVHIRCICLVFLHCALPNVSSKRLHEKRQSHIGSICWTFLHCAFSNVSSKYLHKRMHTHIGCNYLACLHCALSYFSMIAFSQLRHN